MMLTKHQYVEEPAGVERTITDILYKYDIRINKPAFYWSSSIECRHHMEQIYPEYYRHKYFAFDEKIQCPNNTIIETIELENYWQKKMDNIDNAIDYRKKCLKAIFYLFLFFFAVVLFIYLIDSNFELY
jgi:hypothetical protein